MQMLHELCWLTRFALLNLYMSGVTLAFLSALSFAIDFRGFERLLAIPSSALTWLLGSWVPVVGRALRIW